MERSLFTRYSHFYWSCLVQRIIYCFHQTISKQELLDANTSLNKLTKKAFLEMSELNSTYNVEGKRVNHKCCELDEKTYEGELVYLRTATECVLKVQLQNFISMEMIRGY